MSVWRKKSVRTLLGGRRVPPGTKGAKKRTELSKRFYGTLTLADGSTRQVPLAEGRDASLTLLRRLQADEDRNRALGIDAKTRERARPLAAHLTDYEAHLRSKRSTDRYVVQTLNRLRSVIDAVKAKTPADLDSGKVSAVLATWRSRDTDPLCTQTTNHYVRCVKAFSRWLWVDMRSPDDSLRSLKTLNARADRRHARRPLTPEELDRLLTAVRSEGRTDRGRTFTLTPDDRATLYTLAAYTGLRVSELTSLTPASFDLAAGTVTVRAAYSKRRRDDMLPLHASIVGPLRAWLDTKSADLPLWSGHWARARLAAAILRRDLAAAGIAYRDAQGRYVDFHALRHTFISQLARSGVHPNAAKGLARHSTITLTMDVYSHVETEELRRSLDTLPALPGTRPPEPPPGTLPRVA